MSITEIDPNSKAMRILGGITTMWKRCWTGPVDNGVSFFANEWRVPKMPGLEPFDGMRVIMLFRATDYSMDQSYWMWPESSGISYEQGAAHAFALASWPSWGSRVARGDS